MTALKVMTLGEGTVQNNVMAFLQKISYGWIEKMEGWLLRNISSGHNKHRLQCDVEQARLDAFVYLSIRNQSTSCTTLNWSGHLVRLVPNPHLTAHMLVISQWSSIAHLLITISTAHGYW